MVLKNLKRKTKFAEDLCNCSLQPLHVNAAHTTHCKCGLSVTDFEQVHPECHHGMPWHEWNIEQMARKEFYGISNA